MRRPRPIVLFVDHQGWDCFVQLAAALRRAGLRTMCACTVNDRYDQARFRSAYGKILQPGSPRDMRLLYELARTGRIVDVQIAESAFVHFSETPLHDLLTSGAIPAARHHVELLDKLAVSRRLAAAGATVPRTIEVPAGADPEAIPALAVPLGYPLVLKRRIGCGGQGVAIVAGPQDAVAQARRLGTDALFLEQHIDGGIVQYSAVALDGAPLPGTEVTKAIERHPENPLGPSSAVTIIDDPVLLAAGRRVAAAIAAHGLLDFEFVRDRSGACHHIDASTRSFGNFAALQLAGVDLVGGYLRSLGQPAARPRGASPAPGTTIVVFPSGVIGPPHLRTRASARLFIAACPPYARQFGPRYLATAALIELLRGREHRIAHAAALRAAAL